MVQRTITSNEQKQDDNEILNREDENLYRYNGDIGPKSGTDYEWIKGDNNLAYRDNDKHRYTELLSPYNGEIKKNEVSLQGLHGNKKLFWK